MNQDQKRYRARRIAGEMASKWQDRSRIAIMVVVIIVAYALDVTVYRYNHVSDWVVFIAFWLHIGMQIWLPEKVFAYVYANTYKTIMAEI